MLFHSAFIAAIATLLSGTGLVQAEHLNLTTIALVDGVSVFQCWRLNQTIVPTQTPVGIVKNSTLGPLGGAIDASWLSAPAGSFTPSHAANAVEYNVILSGTLKLGVDSTNQTATIKGGAHGLILVTDTAGTGHTSLITPDAPAVVLMVPIKDDVIPAHTVLHDGQCTECEMDF